jgi:phosphoribosylformimino-5-aminoimidazole carboxamide ribotide isomerase
MLILPAIDLRAGRCVRLRQGRYDQETVFDDDPVAVARRFEAAGATWLHVVDLDGAWAGEPGNLDTVRRITQAVGMQVEVGGGIRTTQAAGEILAMGVARIIVGTRAIREPAWLKELADRFPRQVALGLDSRGSKVGNASGYGSGSPPTATASALAGPSPNAQAPPPAPNAMAAGTFTDGWRVKSQRTVSDLLRDFGKLPLAAIIYTDIARDGMMLGPNLAATAEVVRATVLPVIASGGVTTVQDVERLKAAGVAGAIIGRALYEGTITLEAALAAAR